MSIKLQLASIKQKIKQYTFYKNNQVRKKITWFEKK